MSRFSNLFKNFVTPEDEIPTPSFIKPSNSTAKASNTSDLPVPKILMAPAPEVRFEANKPVSTAKTVTVAVYQSDTEWDVVQRTIHAFAERVRVSDESKQAFIKKWVGVLEKTGQKSLYRAAGEDESSNHLGNKINRAAANPATGLLGNYEAAVDPVKEAGMMYDLQALRQMELSFASIVNSELARAVKNDLRCIILGSVQEQTEAAKNLLQKTQSGQPEAERVYISTKALANSNEMRLNATLKSTVLKMDANKLQQLGIQSGKEDDTKFPPRASVPSHLQQPKSEKTGAAVQSSKENSKLSDSDWVNKQALELFGDLGRK